MYYNGCVVDVMYLVNGKRTSATLQQKRENSVVGKGEARLPFGTEFSIFLRNRNNYDVAVELTMDGTNVLFNDKKIIIQAGDSFIVEGFSERNGVGGKRFLFLDAQSEEAKILGRVSGIKENGIIIAKFYKATEIKNEIKPETKNEDILKKLDAIQEEIRKNRPPVLPYVPYPYPYYPKYPRIPDNSPYAKPYELWYNSSINAQLSTQYQSTDTQVNSTCSIRHFAPTHAQQTNYSKNSQEGVIECGTQHNQQWIQLNYTIGVSIATIEIKVTGYHADSNVCACGTTNALKSKYCSECGRIL